MCSSNKVPSPAHKVLLCLDDGWHAVTATPSAILAMMMKPCSNSCTTQRIPSCTKPIATLCSCLTGEALSAMHVWVGLTIAQILQKSLGNIQFQTPGHLFNTVSNLKLPSFPMHPVVVWNPDAKEVLDCVNKDRFQLLCQTVPEAHCPTPEYF